MNNSNIISLYIKNLNEDFYIDIDKRFLDNFVYLYKTISRKLIVLFGNKLSINNKTFMYNIFYYKNNIKKYIFMTILDESLVLHLDDINNDFYLIKSELLKHERHIIQINHLYIKKNWNFLDYWTNSESISEIEKYLENNLLKIYNKNLMIILNKNQINLKYAADELLNDKEFLLPLMDNDYNYYIVCTYDNEYILPIPIRYDLDIIYITFKYYHKVFMCLSKFFRYNLDVVLAALNSNQISVLTYTSNEIREKLKKMDINIPDLAGSLYDTHEY